MNKQDFEELCSKYESVGILPKGKTADLMENYPFIVGELEGAEVDHDALDEKTKVRARKA